jgi:hypothetical protein
MKCAFVAAALAMMFASAAAAQTAIPDQRLAESLIPARTDVPDFWVEWKAQGDRLLDCVANAAPNRVTARARSIVGGPNDGVSSLAIVMPDRSHANQYYRSAVRAVRECVGHERYLTGAQLHPNHVWHVQPLTVGRYGRQSGAWRIRFLRGSEHRALDWSVVMTGRAVLVDIFELGLYDAHWKDISVAHGVGGSVRNVERRVLTNAARRAAA